MERCATCKWWKPLRDGYDNALADSGWGFPRQLEHIKDRLGKCVIASSSGGLPVTEGRLSFAADYEEYQADLITFDDFGCVQHEPREDIA